MFSKRQKDEKPPPSKSLADRRIEQRFAISYMPGQPIPALPQTDWAKLIRQKCLALAVNAPTATESPQRPVPVVREAKAAVPPRIIMVSPEAATIDAEMQRRYEQQRARVDASEKLMQQQRCINKKEVSHI